MQENRLKRLLIYGIVGIIYSILLLADNIFRKMSIIEVIIGISLFICSIIFIVTRKKIIEKTNYLKQKNSQKK